MELKYLSTHFTLRFCLLYSQWLREGLGKLFCNMEKEDLKILNKGVEEEMVCLFHFTSMPMSEFVFWLIRALLLFSCHPSGAAELPSVSLAAGPGGPWGAVYRRLPPPVALLDARVVRQIHLHPYHSPWCWSSIAALHGRLHIELLLLINFLNQQ